MSINLLETLKYYVLKRGVIGIGRFLIGSGVSIIAFDPIWWFITKMVLNIESSDEDELTKYQIITSSILILVGGIVFIVWYIIERKKRFLRVNFNKFDLVISPHHSDICFEDWESLEDPNYNFEISFDLLAGNRDVFIQKIEIIRFIKKYDCMMKLPMLVELIPGASIFNNSDRIENIRYYFHSDWQSIDSLKIPAMETKKMLYKRHAKGPFKNYSPVKGHEFTRGLGNYKFEISYRFRDNPMIHTFKCKLEENESTNNNLDVQ